MTSNGRKTDPVDARSVPWPPLYAPADPGLRPVTPICEPWPTGSSASSSYLTTRATYNENTAGAHRLTLAP